MCVLYIYVYVCVCVVYICICVYMTLDFIPVASLPWSSPPPLAAPFFLPNMPHSAFMT